MKKLIKNALAFVKREWFLLVMVATIFLIVILFEVI